jgi:transcriptional regulator GlxA family with amidase domain
MGIPHRLIIDSATPWRECFLAFAGDLQTDLPAMGIAHPQRPVLNPGLTQELVERFESILALLDEEGTTSSARIFSSMLDLLIHLHEEDQRSSLPTAHAHALQQSSLLLKTHLKSRASIQEIVAPLNLGYENFRKLFTEHVGMSPAAYRIRARIDKACRLLKEERCSVKAAAARLGYTSPYAFSAQFKQIMGQPPGRFRDGQ